MNEAEALANLARLRAKEREIMALKERLASQTILSDAEQLAQLELLAEWTREDARRALDE